MNFIFINLYYWQLSSNAMKFKILMWIAILLILVTGYLHFITIPEEYAEAPYIGWLFFANGIGSIISAVGIYRNKVWWGWALGILTLQSAPF